MLNINQWTGINFNIIVILFSILVLIIFVLLTIRTIKIRFVGKGISPEYSMDIGKLPSKKINTLRWMFNIVWMQIIPYLFIAILLMWTILMLFPNVINKFLYADSTQEIVLKNTSDKKQDVVFIGRKSYSNEWNIIIPELPFADHKPIKEIAAKSSKKYIIRTGTKDIDYLIIANITSGDYRLATGLAIKVPQNSLLCYVDILDDLKSTPRVNLLNILVSIALFITAIIGTILIFFKRFAEINENKIRRLALLSILVGFHIFIFGNVVWSNIKAILLFM